MASIYGGDDRPYRFNGRMPDPVVLRIIGGLVLFWLVVTALASWLESFSS
jgi:hypothetical protein